jgi:hypothetical protein
VLELRAAFVDGVQQRSDGRPLAKHDEILKVAKFLRQLVEDVRVGRQRVGREILKKSRVIPMVFDPLAPFVKILRPPARPRRPKRAPSVAVGTRQTGAEDGERIAERRPIPDSRFGKGKTDECAANVHRRNCIAARFQLPQDRWRDIQFPHGLDHGVRIAHRSEGTARVAK